MGEWKEYRLGDICEIFDGPHATPPKQDDGLIFLGISSLGFDGRINPAHFEYVSEESFKKWTRRVTPQYEDIVFSYETKLGVAAMIPNNFICCLGRRMGLLRPKKEIFPRFLLYAYLAPEFQTTIYERTYHGSTVDRIPLKEMADFPIRLPSFSEQKAIAAVLSGLDDKIDLLQRQNRTLEALAETLFRQWFVEEAQEEWEEVPLSFFGDIICGKTPSKKIRNYFNGEIPFIKIPDMHGNVFLFETSDSLTEEGKRSQSNKTLPPRSICVSCIATVGLVSMNAKESQTNQQINSIIPKKNYYRYFLYLTMKASYDLLHSMASGGTATLNLNTGNFSKIPILYPGDRLLTDFQNEVEPFFDKIFVNQTQIRTLEQLRDTLLPKLMSGEARVEI